MSQSTVMHDLISTAVKWWEGFRPPTWSEEQHLRSPQVNAQTDEDRALALGVAAFVRRRNAEMRAAADRPKPELGAAAICQEQSDPSLGWTIRRITRVRGEEVTLNDGVSFASPCFASAVAGDIWAVCHEHGDAACFGVVRRAYLLEPVRNVASDDT